MFLNLTVSASTLKSKASPYSPCERSLLKPQTPQALLHVYIPYWNPYRVELWIMGRVLADMTVAG